MLNEEMFMKGMALLTAAYPDYECTPETMAVYREILRHDFTDLEFEKVVLLHIRKHRWFPKVSELLQAKASHQPTAIDVWNRLILAAEAGEKPELDGAAEKALAVLGGWEEFSRTDYRELGFRFKDFKVAYLEAREQESTRPQIAHQPVPQLEGQ